jgi:protein-export membrane protein SecD/preprotein translocase SecF subunit
MRSFTWKIALCVGLVVGSLIVNGWAAYLYVTEGTGFKLGVDLVGGTILVYEVDKDKFPDAQAIAEFKQHSQQLATSLKHRIDPADLYNVTIRQVGDWRVEIILPTGGQHQADLEYRAWNNLLSLVRKQYDLPEADFDDVPQGQTSLLTDKVYRLCEEAGRKQSPEEIGQFIGDHYKIRALTQEQVQAVKQKIAQVGSLEFRILANEHDDKRAIDLARKYFEAAQNSDGPERQALAKAAIVGQPPAPPVETDGNPKIGTSTGLGQFTYSWVELGRSERETLGFNNASEGYYTADPNHPGTKILVPVLEFNTSPEYLADLEKNYPNQYQAYRRQIRWHDAAVARGEEKRVEEMRDGQPVVKFVKTKDEAWTKLLDEVRKHYELPASADLKVPRGEVDQLANRVHDLLKTNKKTEQTAMSISRWIDEHYKVNSFGTMALPEMGGALMYSRRVPNPSRLPPDEKDKKIEYFVLTRDPQKGKEVTGVYLQGAQPGVDEQQRPDVQFRFNQAGGDRFFDLTSQNAPTRDGFHRFLAIVLDGKIISAPSLNAKIHSEGIITGNFTADEVSRIVNLLNSGALPASLKPQPVSENTIGPTLGADTVKWGTISVGVAFLAVLVFMLFYYRFSGIVACVALLANLLLTIAFMVLVNATFTLPGLAGLVLMLGMAVDANVLIYERLREERDRGATLALAIRNGYDRAFPVILDTHLSSIFTAIVLYAVGNDQLKGFGISLTVGLLISLFTSLFMTRLMFDFWFAKGWLPKLSMLRLLSRTNIDFMAVRHYFFAGTIAVSVLGAALFVYHLPRGGLNIDFEGGTAYTGQLVKPVTIDTLQRLVSEKWQEQMLRNPEVKEVGSSGLSYDIRYPGETEWRHIELPDRPQHGVDEVRQRAQHLPAASVDQIFVSSSDPSVREGNRSAFFTVRTTEKAPELVQTIITRLFREKKGDEYADLLKKIGMMPVDAQHLDKPLVSIGENNTEATLHFVDLDRFHNRAPVTGEAWARLQAVVRQKYKLPADTKFGVEEGPDDVDNLIRRTQGILADRKEKVTPAAVRDYVNGEAYGAFASPTEVHTLLSREFRAIPSLDSLVQQFTLEGVGKQENGKFETMHLQLAQKVERKDLATALTSLQKQFSDRPTPERLENFDSALAAETQQRAFYAILASWAAILLFLWFRFGNWTFGAAAVACLIHDLCFTLGCIAVAHYIHYGWPGLAQALMLEDFKIDLPAVAALLTLVGYSVNDTIVVFDRIREVRGKNPELTFKTINDSVNQTLSRTLLTATTVFLVVFVLYVLGGEGVHLFAYVMVVGVLVGTYSSIYIASPLLIVFGEGRHGLPVREKAPEPAGRA